MWAGDRTEVEVAIVGGGRLVCAGTAIFPTSDFANSTLTVALVSASNLSAMEIIGAEIREFHFVTVSLMNAMGLSRILPRN
jgi:hypothetical protein